MNEYISREDVLKKAKSSISVPTDNEWDCGYNTAMAEMQEFIKQLPVADVQPVKHGRWIIKGQEIYCSECDTESSYNSFGASQFTRFCPHCGARMDGESK